MIKLTVREREVLDHLISGEKANYAPYMGRFRENPYWYVWNFKRHKVTKEMNKLLDLGLVIISKKDWHGDEAKAAPDAKEKIANFAQQPHAVKGETPTLLSATSA